MNGLRHHENLAVARLHALLELLPAALDRELAGSGLTTFEVTLLGALREADAGRLRLTALASRTNATLPRLSRVVSGLERKGLVVRVACEQDGRATNAVLTAVGERAHDHARPLYDEATRRLILDGLDDAGVANLAALSLAILTRLDPERRLTITSDSDVEDCPADPLPRGVH